MDEIVRQNVEAAKAYHPPESAVELVRKATVFVVSGPIGSGTSAIVEQLLEDKRYSRLVSHTTRPPRDNEANGQRYYFVDSATMNEMIKDGRFFEVRQVYDNYLFGTSIAEIKRIKEEELIGLAHVDVYGAGSFIKSNPDIKAVFLLPPSYDEWQRRLSQRGDQDYIRRRLQDAHDWLETALKDGFWHFVIDAGVEKAVSDIKAYIEEPNFQPKQDETLVEHAWLVLGELKHNLNT